MRKAIQIIALTIIMASLLVAPAFAGPDCSADHSKNASTIKTGKCPPECAKLCEEHEGQCEHRMIAVQGMTCTGCENTLKKTLSSVDGVLAVICVSHKDGVAEVCIDPTKVKDEDLTKAVVAKGYKAEIAQASITKTEGDATGITKTSSGVPMKVCSETCVKTCAKPCGSAKDLYHKGHHHDLRS